MKILTANEGMWLTNGETFSKKVYIGRTGNAEDWQEVTDEEKNTIEAKLKSEEYTDEDLINKVVSE